MTGRATRKPHSTALMPEGPFLKARSGRPSETRLAAARRGRGGRNQEGSTGSAGEDSPPADAEIVHPGIEIPKDAISAFCGKWGIAELALFGSALREDFRPGSDVDLLVRFAPGREYGLLAFARMQGELEAIFGRRVDLVTEKAVEGSENRIKRRHILDTKVVIHAAG
jgi:uncharacterized protein